MAKARPKTKTRRVTGKRKKKDEPKFHLGLKTFLLLGSIVAVIIVMILLSNWSTGRRSLSKDISKARARHEVKINNLEYNHKETMKDLQDEIVTLEENIDDLKLQIAIVKGEQEYRDS